MLKKLGKIDVVNKVVIADPTYANRITRDPIRNFVITLNLTKGKWDAYVRITNTHFGGLRNADLIIAKKQIPAGDWKRFDNRKCVGVDSGQLGIFNINTIPRSPAAFERWYNQMSDVTIGPGDNAGIVGKNVVTSSGLGDGCYEVFTHVTKNKIDAVRVKML